MHQDRNKNFKVTKSSVTLPTPEKKMNFVLIINTDNLPNRENKKASVPMPTGIEHPLIPESDHLNSVNNKPKVTADKKGFENLFSHSVLTPKNVIIPRISENHLNDFEKNFNKYNFESNNRPIAKLNTLFNHQNTGFHSLHNLNDKYDENSSSNSYY
jgi:hypothetical protein